MPQRNRSLKFVNNRKLGANHWAPVEDRNTSGYNDSTPMPFGKYKGTPLIAVPADYLLWLHKEKCSDMFLMAYIEDNMQALMLEKNKR